MGLEDLIYDGVHLLPKGYYSYWDRSQNCFVITEDYDEFVTRSERNKMGGNMGIHLGVLS